MALHRPANGRPTPLKNLGPDELGDALLAEMTAAHPDSPITAATVDGAIRWAKYLHRDQQRSNPTITTDGEPLPGSEPYVVHPLRNALRIVRWGEADPDIVVAAVLHDVVEDQAGQLARSRPDDSGLLSPDDQRAAALQKISGAFGPRTAHLVEAVSNPIRAVALSKEQKRARYVSHVAEAITEYPVFMVKAADFVDNALGLHHQIDDPRKAAHLGWKYQPLCEVFTRAAEQHQADGHALHPDLVRKLAGAEEYLNALASTGTISESEKRSE